MTKPKPKPMCKSAPAGRAAKLRLVSDPDDAWDKQMKRDAAAGKLDWVSTNALRAYRAKRLRPTPK